MTPHVMAEVVDDDGEVVDRYEPSVASTAMTPEVAAAVRDAMVAVVVDGTATRLAVPGCADGRQDGHGPARQRALPRLGGGVRPRRRTTGGRRRHRRGQEGASEQTGGRVAAPIGQAVLAAALQARP
jgi:peptidoglycan glycosyltransferase